MLYTQTVEPNTFSLLEEIIEVPELKNFALVGGTALSLLFGHRKSEDLDLFSTAPFENDVIINALIKKYNNTFDNRTTNPRFGIFCFIDGVKVDIVRHPHALLKPITNIDGVRMFSVEDIMAMKVQAVLGRGKKKDFWDIAELLQHYPIADFIRCHEEKYKNQNLLITVPQAISYFHDAEESVDPISLKKQTWDSVKKFISTSVREYLK